MKVAGLFAGIGGMELGLEQAGWATSMLCEIDPQATSVLKKRFPSARLASDVRLLKTLPKGVDLLTAGFPCQDLSQAGSTAGIFGSRSGLIRHAIRLVASSKPPFVLFENVPFLLRLDGGRGIAYLVRALERLGYDWAYRVIDSRAFGLPQRRERVFLLASTVDNPGRYLFSTPTASPRNGRAPVACGFYWTEGTRGLGWAVDAVPTIKGGSGLAIPSPPGIWFPDDLIATPDIRDAERLQGFPTDWTKPAEDHGRPSYRWTLVGNAVSVRVARWLGGRLAKGIAIDESTELSELSDSDPWPDAACGGLRSPRFRAILGTFPVAWKPPHLHEFLRFSPKPLSGRATIGFLGRLQKSALSRPKEFERALRNHARRADRLILLSKEN